MAVADWPTYHRNAARTGYDGNLAPVTSVPSTARTVALDGAMYASPIVARGLVIAATENNTVYALDANYHAVWQTHLGTPSPASERPCGNIDPLGITGTPVYDAGTGLVFVAPELSNPVRHQLVALDAKTGAVRWRRTLDLPGVDATAMQERGALTIAGGRVWVPFGGLAGDCGDYKGRVIGYNLSGAGTIARYTVPVTREGGIWTPPGPTVTADGNLLVAVGNGEASSGPWDHSDSVLKISPTGKLLDGFAPTSWPTDNAADKDLGSQGPIRLGPWVIQAGKSGTAYVLRASNLNGVGGQVSSASLCTSFGGGAVVGGVAVLPCTDGLRAVKVSAAGVLQPVWHAPGNVTGSPIIGGGRVWSIANSTLYSLDQATGALVASCAVGAASRFATPAIRGNDILVPTLAGLSVVTVS